jgi:hypothetical protein
MPGGSVGAGGAITCGEKELPPVGLIPFSVGDTVGGGVVAVVVVVVVVEVEGWRGFSWLRILLLLSRSPRGRRNRPGAILKRLTRLELMIHVLSFLSSATTKSLG